MLLSLNPKADVASVGNQGPTDFLQLNLIQSSRMVVEEIQTQPKETTMPNHGIKSSELAVNSAAGQMWSPIKPLDGVLLSAAAASIAISIVYAKFAAFQSIIAGI